MDLITIRLAHRPSILGQATAVWLRCVPNPKVDACYLDHLVHQKVITSTERIMAEVVGIPDTGAVWVVLLDGDVLGIDCEGSVTCVTARIDPSRIRVVEPVSMLARAN